LFNTIFVALQIILALIAIYQFSFSLFGLYKRKIGMVYNPKKSFAILIAAHNESLVIEALLRNLRLLDYPQHLFKVFVICDNCSDNTAEIVNKYPEATALVREDPSKKGKGFGIEWALNQLWRRRDQYDAIVMLDADNLVSKRFLREMNNDLLRGARIIQGYIDTKNPEDSWISAAYGISYWYINRLWQLSRANLGMANFLGGTGMCFESELLKKMGWGATSLVEDLEFTMRAVSNNVYPVFNYNAKVYDEKPITFKASAIQRQRWMQGHFTVARKYFFPLIWKSIKDRSLVKFDLALYSANAYIVLITFILTTISFVDLALFNGSNIKNLYGYLPIWISFAAILANIFTFGISLYLEKVTYKKVYTSLILFPIYLLSWIPITIYAFFTQNNKTWNHTEHTRNLDLYEVGE
jgi:cellulose synthase/poly-beta-1,6-N-acetylglucosamine synthase-like glycosyltransferase